MDTAKLSNHDPATLLLVRGEIDRSCKSVSVNLDAACANPADGLALQTVTADLHQVTGALLMVGLTAAARLSEEAEKLVDGLKGGLPADAVNRVQSVKKAMASMSLYLDNLVKGEPDHPMELAAVYLAMNAARGANDASPNDLFLPDLAAAAAEFNSAGVPAGYEIPVEAISRCRAIFQGGLLKMMRNKDLVGGASHMCDGILAIEALDASSPSRDFWYTTVAFFDAVANDPIGARPFAVPLFGKIDQQIRKLMDGDHNVPEKVFRDLLLVIGKSAARTKRIARVRQLYRLDDLLWFPDSRTQSVPDEKLVPVVAALRQHITGMKNELQLFAEGHASALIALTQQASAVAKIGQQLPNREMVRLLQLLGAVGAHLGKTGGRHSKGQALEIATALLFAEASLNDYFRLTAEFDRQASRTCLRIKNVMTGIELPDFNSSVASLADTRTLQAQTQLLVSQVGREVQANLASIESALDGFFRDPAKKDGLVSIGSLFGQVRGAFSIIEEEEAADLAKRLAERVTQFASGELRGEGDQADAVAEGVSGLGLYITGLQQGSNDAYATLLPTLVRFGIREAVAPISTVSATTAPLDEASEIQVVEMKPQGADVPATALSGPQEQQTLGSAPDAAGLTKALGAEQRDFAGTIAVDQIAAIESAPNAVGALTDRDPRANGAQVDSQLVATPAAVAVNLPPLGTPIAAQPVETSAAAHSSELWISVAANDLTRLADSVAELKASVEERDQRIRGLQAQMVALHREAREVASLRIELKKLRAMLAKAEQKPR